MDQRTDTRSSYDDEFQNSFLINSECDNDQIDEEEITEFISRTHKFKNRSTQESERADSAYIAKGDSRNKCDTPLRNRVEKPVIPFLFIESEKLKSVCTICKKFVFPEERTLFCSNLCGRRQHLHCINFDEVDIDVFNSDICWKCKICINETSFQSSQILDSQPSQDHDSESVMNGDEIDSNGDNLNHITGFSKRVFPLSSSPESLETVRSSKILSSKMSSQIPLAKKHAADKKANSFDISIDKVDAGSNSPQSRTAKIFNDSKLSDTYYEKEPSFIRADRMSDSLSENNGNKNKKVNISYIKVENFTRLKKPMLFDSQGFSYSFKRSSSLHTTYQCSCKRRSNCGVIISQKGNNYIRSEEHTHKGDVTKYLDVKNNKNKNKVINQKGRVENKHKGVPKLRSNQKIKLEKEITDIRQPNSKSVKQNKPKELSKRKPISGKSTYFVLHNDSDDNPSLFDTTLGYMYKLHKTTERTKQWLCVKSSSGEKCEAAVKQVGNYFISSRHKHNHKDDTKEQVIKKIEHGIFNATSAVKLTKLHGTSNSDQNSIETRKLSSTKNISPRDRKLENGKSTPQKISPPLKISPRKNNPRKNNPRSTFSVYRNSLSTQKKDISPDLNEKRKIRKNTPRNTSSVYRRSSTQEEAISSTNLPLVESVVAHIKNEDENPQSNALKSKSRVKKSTSSSQNEVSPFDPPISSSVNTASASPINSTPASSSINTTPTSSPINTTEVVNSGDSTLKNTIKRTSGTYKHSSTPRKVVPTSTTLASTSSLASSLSHNESIETMESLTLECEKELINIFISMDAVGVSLTNRVMIDITQDYFDSVNHQSLSFSKKPRRWIVDFVEKHTDQLGDKYISKSNHNELSSLSITKVNSLLKNLEKLLKSHRLSINKILSQPNSHRVFNCDSLEIPVKAASPKNVASDIDTREENQRVLNILICVNAVGQSVNPFIINKGDKVFSFAKSKDLEGSYNCVCSSSGEMTKNLFISWLSDHFIKFLDENNIIRPVVLFLNGTNHFASWKGVKFANSNGIILYHFPPLTARICQPLSKSIFSTIKKKYKITEEKLKSNSNKLYRVFPSLFMKAYNEVDLATLSKDSFRDTGICPLDQQILTISEVKLSHMRRRKMTSMSPPKIRSCKRKISSESCQLKLSPDSSFASVDLNPFQTPRKKIVKPTLETNKENVVENNSKRGSTMKNNSDNKSKVTKSIKESSESSKETKSNTESSESKKLSIDKSSLKIGYQLALSNVEKIFNAVVEPSLLEVFQRKLENKEEYPDATFIIWRGLQQLKDVPDILCSP